MRRMSAGETLLRLADNWDVTAHPMTKNSFGVWEITLPAKDGVPVIPHDSKIKVSVHRVNQAGRISFNIAALRR